jgi:hypothetical protein
MKEIRAASLFRHGTRSSKLADRLRHESQSDSSADPLLQDEPQRAARATSGQSHRTDDQQAIRNQLLDMILRNEASRKFSRNEP